MRSWLLTAAFLGGLGGTVGGVAGGTLLLELAEGRARERLFGFQSGPAVLAGMTGAALGGLLLGFLSAQFSLPPEGPEVYKLVIIQSFAIFLVPIIPIFAMESAPDGPHSPVVICRKFWGSSGTPGRGERDLHGVLEWQVGLGIPYFRPHPGPLRLFSPFPGHCGSLQSCHLLNKAGLRETF